ncbi:hypothetical protein ACLOJK_005490 [Asimina triloba]
MDVPALLLPSRLHCQPHLTSMSVATNVSSSSALFSPLTQVRFSLPPSPLLLHLTHYKFIPSLFSPLPLIFASDRREENALVFPSDSPRISSPNPDRLFPQSMLPPATLLRLLWMPVIRASDLIPFLDSFVSSKLSLSTELDAVARFKFAVVDSLFFLIGIFENGVECRFPPTAATVSSSLLLGICSLPDTKFKSAVETALADGQCYAEANSTTRLSCFFSKALVHVGAELAKLVPGRVSTEVDARLAYDTHDIVRKVYELLKLYDEVAVPPERLLFKIPSTWQGIEASRLLESEGIQTHMTFVYRILEYEERPSFSQAAAAAQAGASVIQIFVGRIRDWARNHSGDPEVEAASKRGEDPGLALVGVDYIIVPLKILQSLKESVSPLDGKYSFVRRLAPSSAILYNFSEEELLTWFVDEELIIWRVQLLKWDQLSFASAMGPAAEELLGAGLEGYMNQTKRVEEFFGKIWPPPNV